MSRKNPVALITGSAHRIGACIARHLHTHGYRVIIHYHSSAKTALTFAAELNQLRENSASAIQANLSDLDEVNQLAKFAVDQFGRLDLLVNNASRFFPTPIGDVTISQWENLVNTNLRAPFFLTQALRDDLQKSKGNIINITDVYGHRPLESHTIYSMTKAGLIMLTQSLAKDLGPYIRVNAVSPGAIIWPDGELTEQRKEEILERTSLQRLGEPDDIAETVRYLANADYISGQIIAVDGGRLGHI